MAETHNTAEVDILHPLAILHCQCYHTWKNYNPTHCAVLQDKMAILTQKDKCRDVLFILSLDFQPLDTITLPYEYMSLATFKSQFVAVGGRDPYTRKPTNLAYASGTGLEWQPSLPHMTTERWWVSLASSISPEVLVAAGGCDYSDYSEVTLLSGKGCRVSYNESNYRRLADIEVLVEDNWLSVDPLPNPCSRIQSTFHQDEIVITDRESSSMYSCNIASLISVFTDTPQWRHFEAPGTNTTTASYSSRLVNIDYYGTIRGYCSVTHSWVEATMAGEKTSFVYNGTATILPTGEIAMAWSNGIYKMKVFKSSYDPGSKFMPNVLSRLEAVMGIQILSVIANSHSQLTASSGVKLQTRRHHWGHKIVLPDPQTHPVQYIEEVILQWSERHSQRPPTWKQLFDVLQDLQLTELSRIKAIF